MGLVTQWTGFNGGRGLLILLAVGRYFLALPKPVVVTRWGPDIR